MAIPVQTVRLFSEQTGISVTKVKELIKQGVIPEIQREDENGLQLINRTLFDDLVKKNALCLPRAIRSKKNDKSITKENMEDKK